MSDAVRETAVRIDCPGDAPVLQRLSTLDRFLPVWIFAAMALGLGLGLGMRLRLGHATTATLAFTAAGDSVEPAIAVAIGSFGVTGGQARAGVVGPLIEIPALAALVYVALWARRRFVGEAAR